MLKAICALLGVILLCFASFSMGVNSVTPTIITTNNCNLPEYNNLGQQINGFYDPLSGYLMVYTGHLTAEQAEYTMLHEYGHYKYYLETGEIIVTEKSEAYAQNYAATHTINGVV